MNHKITQMFVVKDSSSFPTVGTSTSALTEGQLGVFNSSYSAITSAPSVASSPYLYIAQGSGKSTVGSWKTPKIYLTKVTKWAGDSADTSSQEQITYVGFDEINDCNSPSIACDKTYNVTIRVFEHYLRSVYAKALQEGITVKSACCADCSDNCDSLDPLVIMEEFATKINENPRLKNYVTATAVSKLISGSAPTVTYSLVLPDPGTHLGGVVDVTASVPGASSYTAGTYTGVTASATSGSGTSAAFTFVMTTSAVTSVTVTTAGSGYKIGDTLTISSGITGLSSPAEDITLTVTETDGPEGTLIGAVRDAYTTLVANAETDIVYSTDTDSTDGDSNATGNVMITATPGTGVTLADFEPYEGIEWVETPCLTASTAVYAAGLKLVGITPDGFSNDCLPDSIPYIANKTRFKVYAGEGPVGTQYADLPSFCENWVINTTQEVRYAVGEGKAIAELERHTYNWKEPYAKRYWVSYFNDELKTFCDPTLEYDIYYLDYQDPSDSEFLQKDPDGNQLMVAVPSTMTAWKTAFETVMNTYLANSPAYQGSVAL